MRTEYRYCEDCREEVTVYGGYDMADEFIEEDREGHEGHDLSDPAYYDRGY